ncbi:MAG TPA: hypothetical protein VN648_30525 [Candidatus Methylomirabilis sp.]|nr:hypothetical protein [Candidatus Methylomirabilis sp.]
MNTENHSKLKAAFIAGRLDARLSMDRGRWSAREREYVETLLGMVLGDADLKGLTDNCEVLFRKGGDPFPSDLDDALVTMERELFVRNPAR